MRRYPKLLLLLLSFVFAYGLYHAGAFDWLGRTLNGYGYISVFLGGMLFSFGFTAAFGIGIFVEMATHTHPLLAAPIAGVGALLSDFLIFRIIRFSFFHDELHRLRSARLFGWLHNLLHHENVPERLRRTLLWSFAGIVIASPLPDELGVSLISSISTIREREFAVLCFALNTIGILLILITATSIA